MTKVHLLGANRSYDRDVQTVLVNQVVVLEGYSYDSYVGHRLHSPSYPLGNQPYHG